MFSNRNSFAAHRFTFISLLLLACCFRVFYTLCTRMCALGSWPGSRAIAPRPKFWAVWKLLENLLSQNSLSEVQNLGPKTTCWGNIGAKSKFLAPIISSIRNLQVFFRRFLEICSACWKNNFLLHLLFQPRAPLYACFPIHKTTVCLPVYTGYVCYWCIVLC